MRFFITILFGRLLLSGAAFGQQIIGAKGINDLTIKESKFSAVKKKYPKGKCIKSKRKDRIRYGMAKLRSGGCIKVKMKKLSPKYYRFLTSDSTICFVFDQNKILKSIELSGAALYQSNRGIVAGKSLFFEALKAYENSIIIERTTKDNKKYASLAYEHISFKSEDYTGKRNTLESLEIKTIVIY